MNSSLIHIPKTAGSSVAVAYGLLDSHVIARARAMDEPNWSSHYRFSIVRNPWDRVVSLWYHWGAHECFDEWVLEQALSPAVTIRALPNGSFRPTCDPHKTLEQWPYVCDEDGTSMVHTLLAFEHLGKWNLPIAQVTALPHVHRSAPRGSYAGYYAETSTRDIVEALNHHVIELMEYRFGVSTCKASHSFATR